MLPSAPLKAHRYLHREPASWDGVRALILTPNLPVIQFFRTRVLRGWSDLGLEIHELSGLPLSATMGADRRLRSPHWALRLDTSLLQHTASFV